MIKDIEYFNFIKLWKFMSIKTKLDLNKIVFYQKKLLREIFSTTNYIIDCTWSKNIAKKKLSCKKQYVLKNKSDTYIQFMF